MEGTPLAQTEEEGKAEKGGGGGGLRRNVRAWIICLALAGPQTLWLWVRFAPAGPVNARGL